MEGAISARLTPAEGRKFAFPVGTAFLILGGIAWWRGHDPTAIGFASVAGALIVAGAVVPGKLGPIYRAWMAFAHLLSKITTPIFMGITYFLVLAPIGLLVRLFGRNPVVQELNDGSFWVARPEGPKRRSDLSRQF